MEHPTKTSDKEELTAAEELHRPIVTDVSTMNLVDPLQIGWVHYREGDAIIKAKVIRSREGTAFAALPSVYRHGLGAIPVIDYENFLIWDYKRAVLLDAYKEFLGQNRFIDQLSAPLPCPPKKKRRG